MQFDEWFEKYKTNLAIGGRELTISKALQLLLDRYPEGGNIVETGTTRMENDWGAGSFSIVAGDFCKQVTQYHLFTCDIDHNAMQVCKQLTKEYAPFTTYIENDSVEFLTTFNQKISLLYLDSLDIPEYDSPESLEVIKAQIHQEREIKAAYDKLVDDPIILLDDAQFPNGGKVRLSSQFLKEQLFEPIILHKQTLWIKAKG